MITSRASTIAARTRARIARLRLLAVTLWLGPCLGRGEYEQHPAVVVVRREDVGLRSLRPVPLRVNGNRLVEHPHAPLECGRDVVVAALEVEPEHLLDGTADHVGVAKSGELARAPAGADQ